MTEDWIALGSSPLSELTCFENEEWTEKYGNKVLLAWFNQLRRTFPNFYNKIVIKESQQKFFVVIIFEDEVQFEYAKNVADELPYSWDEKAKEELGNKYFKDTRETYCSQYKTEL